MKAKYPVILITILSVIFLIYQLIAATGRVPRRSGDSQPSKPRLAGKDAQDQKTLAHSLPKEEQQAERAHTSWGDFVYPDQADIRDPFQKKEMQTEPLVEEKDEALLPSVTLTGVIYSDWAIFADDKGNSYRVKEGEAVFDLIVKKILKNSVIVRRSGEDTEMRVFDAAFN